MKLYSRHYVCIVLLILSSLAVHTSARAQWTLSKSFNNNAPGTKIASVCTDASGNVYMTGSISRNATFTTFAFDAITLTPSNAIEGFVAKFNSSGVCQWAIRFGGTSNDRGDGIATDGSSVYVIGRFTNSMTVGASATVYNAAGGTDGVVLKLNASTGATTWVTTFGGTDFDWGQAVCLDPSGNVYISGTFATSATFGSFTRNENSAAVADMFVAKLNSSGTFQWASTGGSAGNDDNVNGSSICYVPGLDEIVFAGCYENSTATYTTASPASTVTLTNSGAQDMCLLEINASNGTFISGISAGGTGNEQALGAVWEPINQRVIFTGAFSSTSTSIGGNTVTNGSVGTEDVFYASYDPSANTVSWAKKAGTAGLDDDRGNAICANGRGEVIIAGSYGTSGTGTISFPATPSALTLTNTRGVGFSSNPFVVKVDGATGNALLATQGAGDNSSALADLATGIAAVKTGAIWTTGSFVGKITFSPTAQLSSYSSTPYTTPAILLANYNDPPAALAATTSSTSPTCNNGCNGTASVTPSGGYPPYTYSWSPSGGTAATATGLCVGSYVCTITDASSTSIMKTVVVSAPATTLPTAGGTAINTTFNVNASNTIIADPSCNLVCKVVPSGLPSQVSGTVTAKVWIANSVPTYGQPFVARHYEITPATNASTATGTVTLYFTQAEFTAFNAAPGSTLNLPTASGDAAGKANLRIGRYPGTSSNGSGLPATYASTPTVIDPVDANIVYNTGVTPNRWEVTFDVVGFSGFVVQTTVVPLPVTWINVTASLTAQNYAEINWTVDEQNVERYIIEQSADGVNFVAVATIAGQGDGQHSYHYQQSQALQGAAYFRIRQTDKDGKESYSKVLLLKAERSGSVTVYPNPVKAQATLNITDRALLNTTAILYDVTGKQVQQVRISQTVTTIDMQRCTKGVYLLKLHNGQSVRLVKE